MVDYKNRAGAVRYRTAHGNRINIERSGVDVSKDWDKALIGTPVRLPMSVIGGTITSLPGGSPNAAMAICTAAVPIEQAIQCFRLYISAKRFWNSKTLIPVKKTACLNQRLLQVLQIQFAMPLAQRERRLLGGRISVNRQFWDVVCL